MSVPGAAVRAAAARVLDRVLVDGRSLKPELAAALPTLADPRDRALLEAICFEVLRRRRRYQWLRERLLERPLPQRSRPLPALLLAGLAQLDGLGVAEHAAIAATAEAARLLRQPRLVGLVNAVLRRFVREREALAAGADAEAARHREHPDWLREAIAAGWPQQADAVFAANDTPGPQWLRVNLAKLSRRDYLARLAAAGLDAEAPDQPAAALRLHGRCPAERLPGWADGLVSVQDRSPQFTAQLLAAAPGQRVLDACAAPGGKAAQLLETTPELELLATDVDATRTQRIGATLSRLGLQAKLAVADAAQPVGWWDGRPFQRILLDAPCSGTGVIRRQPDIKWHRRPADVAAATALQARLLDALWPMLAPGGRLVYATCSILRDENARQIDGFLQRHPDARAQPIALPAGSADGAGWQILPGEGDADGFFYAVLDRA